MVGAAYRQSESSVVAAVEIPGAEDRFLLALGSSTTIVDGRMDVANHLRITCTLCDEAVTLGPILRADKLHSITWFAENHACS
jgi:hypothetical protein